MGAAHTKGCIYIFFCIYPSPLGSLPPQHLSLVPLSLLLFLLWALSKHARSRYSFFVYRYLSSLIFSTAFLWDFVVYEYLPFNL